MSKFGPNPKLKIKSKRNSKTVLSNSYVPGTTRTMDAACHALTCMRSVMPVKRYSMLTNGGKLRMQSCVLSAFACRSIRLPHAERLNRGRHACRHVYNGGNTRMRGTLECWHPRVPQPLKVPPNSLLNSARDPGEFQIGRARQTVTTGQILV